MIQRRKVDILGQETRREGRKAKSLGTGSVCWEEKWRSYSEREICKECSGGKTSAK